MEAAIDRIMQTYNLLVVRSVASTDEARAKVTEYVNTLFEAGERDMALSQWAEVARGLDELGAKADAERVSRTLREHGGVPESRRRAGRRGYGNRLSPREQEVVELLLSGLTNREIAVALSRSPKTVAAQLNSAMRKHGVSTRTALAVVVTQTKYASSDESAG